MQSLVKVNLSVDKQNKILVNPPPSNGRCQCCGKHISELKPFGKAGDPLVGDFNGALLVKTYRSSPDGMISASWECRDCIILLKREYRRKKSKS